jgi:hypothetical protein
MGKRRHILYYRRLCEEALRASGVQLKLSFSLSDIRVRRQ